MQEIHDFMHYVMKLKKTKRAGWVFYNIDDPESVADHSYGVAILAMLVADRFKVDQAKLLKIALLHDLVESISGDMIIDRGARKVLSKKEKSDKEISALKKICSTVKNGQDFFELWMEFESQASKEAVLVRQLDKIEMVMQALDYEETHDPSHFDEFWISAKTYLKDQELLELFNIIHKKRKKK